MPRPRPGSAESAVSVCGPRIEAGCSRSLAVEEGWAVGETRPCDPLDGRASRSRERDLRWAEGFPEDRWRGGGRAVGDLVGTVGPAWRGQGLGLSERRRAQRGGARESRLESVGAGRAGAARLCGAGLVS